MDSGVHYGTLQERRSEMERRLEEAEVFIRNRGAAVPSVLRLTPQAFQAIPQDGCGNLSDRQWFRDGRCSFRPDFQAPFLTLSGGER
jgi:hypothetical protein